MLNFQHRPSPDWKDSHLPCCHALDRNNWATHVMQQIEDTNQRGLVRQATRQDRHRITFRIDYLIDRHTAIIIGPMLIQTARDTDPIHHWFNQTGAWAVYFHCTFLADTPALREKKVPTCPLSLESEKVSPPTSCCIQGCDCDWYTHYCYTRRYRVRVPGSPGANPNR